MKTSWIFAILVWTQFAVAQDFVKVPYAPPIEGLGYSSIAFLDTYWDGQDDLLICGLGKDSLPISSLYLNKGDGIYWLPPSPSFVAIENGSIITADADGDGDLDVLITGRGKDSLPVSKLYIRDVNGGFSEQIEAPLEGVEDGAVAFSDVNGDGYEDLLITGTDSSGMFISKLYLNDSSTVFTEKPGLGIEGIGHGAVAFSDVDNDGDEDMIIAGEDSSGLITTRLYNNDSNGNFTAQVRVAFEGIKHGSLVFADVESDGDNDLVISGLNASNITTSKLYLNDGAGNFSHQAAVSLEGAYHGTTLMSDFDKDGDSDLVITGFANDGSAISKLYWNDSNGNYSEQPGMVFEGVGYSDLACSDIDKDGDDDLVIAGLTNGGSFITKIYLNNNGAFEEQRGTPFEGTIYGATIFSDVNADGYQDVLITGQGRLSIGIAKLYLNDGSGYFIEKKSPFEGVILSAAAFSDVDGDNDEDLVIAGMNHLGIRHTRLYVNDGNGVFSEKEASFTGVCAGSLAFSDIDLDGDNDLLVTGQHQDLTFTAKLYLNDGNGVFQKKTNTPFEEVADDALAFSDIDGDGDEDLLLTGGTNDNTFIAKLYINDGSGEFSEQINPPFEGVRSSSITFSDVDKDGDFDLMITGMKNDFSSIAKLYFNDGNGNFIKQIGATFDAVAGGSVAFSDVDGDNDNDLLITGHHGGIGGGPHSKLYLNDGNGNFSELIGPSIIQLRISAVGFADVDGDGDQDLLTTGYTIDSEAISRLYLNMGSLSSTQEGLSRTSLDLKIYPNPSTPGVSVNIAFSTKKNEVISIELYDIHSRLLHQQKEKSPLIGHRKYSISLQGLPRGVYVARLQGDSESSTKRLIIQ